MKTKDICQDALGQIREDILNEKLPFGSLLPTEIELASKLSVSRPTVAKIDNTLQNEGLIKKKPGYGSTVVFSKDKKYYNLGLLLPGSGESEIFGIINDHFLNLSKQKDFNCLWEGTIANNAEVRQNMILKNCESFIDKSVDGVIFSPLERTVKANYLNDKVCKILESKNIPIVLLDRDIYPFPNRSRYDVIGIDNFQAGYIMTDHMIKEGCRKIHFFFRKDSAYSVNLRLAGCRSACFDSGIDFMNDNIFSGEPSDLNLVRKLKIYNKKTGILCANDSTAAVIMSSLTKLGYKISVDLLIAGFDDMKYAKHLQVPLTTYRQPLLDIVNFCYEMIISRIANPKRVAMTINLEGKMVTRESTKFI